ncbi:hypothetical protein [Salinisphaera hydrothermalis]|uniref:hypothetical protein n=1 Tax=Salinisphaera hydrothermalis TaxID=563188 RepID=UPI001E29BCDC|nr:hypothetical protein [Salinisphaera hydrothermalis]
MADQYFDMDAAGRRHAFRASFDEGKDPQMTPIAQMAVVLWRRNRFEALTSDAAERSV